MGVEHLNPDEPEVRTLIAASDAYYRDLYPPESNHLESNEALKLPNVLFVGCRIDGDLVACGAAKSLTDDGSYAEIKRVFVLDHYRGQGLSKKIMNTMESELADSGITLFRLETGVKQPEALALYERLGYRQRGPFGAYQADPLSVFMEKGQDKAASRR